MANKKQEKLGKNPFNFKVPDGFEIIQRHDYEQTPIKIDNDGVFRADVPDTRKPLQIAIKKVDATDGSTVNNKENISPSTEVFPSVYPPDSPVTYKYAPAGWIWDGWI